MNVRPGDLAVVVSTHPDFSVHIGKVVTVAERSPIWADSWITEPRVLHSDGVPIDFADSGLRPIRDSDGEDEMLRIAGLPQKETA